ICVECVCFLYYFFLQCSGPHRHLHSFPTRRSSDLKELRMDVKTRKTARSLRAKLRSPGRPPVLHHAARWPFWQAIARGLSSEERSEEHTSELQSRGHLVCRLLLEKKKKNQ